LSSSVGDIGHAADKLLVHADELLAKQVSSRCHGIESDRPSSAPLKIPFRDSGWPIGAEVAGKYRLLRAVGHGGMGTVFKAENTAIGKIVAVKLLHANLTDDGVVLQRFQREARATVSIGHPNIVEVLDMGQEPSGAPFLVMEYVRGKSLKKVLKEQGTFSTKRAAKVAGQLLEALGATHQRGIVHRDLKPENILLTPRHGDPDFVKVFDFGISTFIESMVELRVDLTPTGFTMATPFYASPEQIRGGKGRDPRVDIYAVGVVLYEMLTGHRPFEGSNLPDLCDRILSGEITPMRAFRKDVPPGLEAVIERALALRPGDRFQTAAEMLWSMVPFGASPPRTDEPEPTDTFTVELRELTARDREGAALAERRVAARPAVQASHTQPDASPKAGGAVRSELARGLLDYFDQQFGRDPVRAVERTLDENVQRKLAVRHGSDAWCDARALAVALDRFDTVFGEGDRAYVAEAGRHFARAHYYAGERVEMFKSITPELFFSMSSDLWNRYVASGDARVTKVGRGYGRMEVRGQESPLLANSVAILGLLDEGLRLAGATGVSVRLAESASVGDNRDLFEAAWTA
jgi:serine/threonine protein kinase